MEYRILTEKYPDDLAKEVTSALAEGWELFKGPFVHEDHYCQAMIRKDTR
jgi:hypothetical protein